MDNILPSVKKYYAAFEKNFLHAGYFKFVCLSVFAVIFFIYSYKAFGSYGYYCNYMVGLDIGFISKGIVGWIFETVWGVPVAESAAVTFSFLVGLLTHITLFMLLGKLFFKASPENLPKFFIAALAFVLIPSLYQVYFTSLYGWIDAIWLPILFLCLFFADKKYSAVIALVLCSFGMLFHYAFAILVFPAVMFIEYHEAQKRSFSPLYSAAPIISTVSTAAWSVYFYIFAKNTVSLSREEFLSYVTSRCSLEITPSWSGYWNLYYDLYLTKGRGLSGTLEMLRQLLTDYHSEPEFYLTIALSVALPFLFFLGMWIYSAIKSKKFSERLLYIALCLLPLATSVIIIAGTDIGRWVYAFIVVDAAVFLYLLCDTDTPISRLMMKSKVMFAAFVAVMAAAYFIANKTGTGVAFL